MTNKQIIGYVAKYFVAIMATQYLFKLAVMAVNYQSDLTFILGFLIYTGLFTGWFLLLRSDWKRWFDKSKNTTTK
jgi:hypothetical protein